VGGQTGTAPRKFGSAARPSSDTRIIVIVISVENRYGSPQDFMNTSLFIVGVVVFSFAALSACKREPQAEPDGCRVVSYDTVTARWVIIRTGEFDGKYLRKRLTVVCDFYKWGDHAPVQGPHACDLHVGELIVNHIEPDAQGKFSNYVHIWEESAEKLVIVQGSGPDHVDQQFTILKNEVLTEPGQ
jgi:hypothetical protein